MEAGEDEVDDAAVREATVEHRRGDEVRAAVAQHVGVAAGGEHVGGDDDPAAVGAGDVDGVGQRCCARGMGA